MNSAIKFTAPDTNALLELLFCNGYVSLIGASRAIYLKIRRHFENLGTFVVFIGVLILMIKENCQVNLLYHSFS